MNLWIGRQVILELSNGSVTKGMLILNGHADCYAISVGSGMKWVLIQDRIFMSSWRNSGVLITEATA